MLGRKALFAAYVAIGLATPGNAATLTVSNDILVGATGVSVGGLLYNVEFKDGSCDGLFDGCPGPRQNFIFDTYDEALVAATALIDQVFNGTFKFAPGKINGCVANTDNECNVLNPYANIYGVLLSSETPRITLNEQPPYLISRNFLPSADTVDYPTFTYAVWSVQTPDATPPSVTLSGPTGLVTGVFEVTATFSEDVTGFEVGDINVANGTIVPNSFTAASASVYKFRVQPDLGETVTVDVPAGVATDLASISNTAADQYTVEADSPGRYFDEVRDQIRTIITGIARQALSSSMRANQQFMTATRSQMISAFIGSGLEQGDGGLPGAIPFDVTGAINIDGTLIQVHAASAGTFGGQTGFDDGINWRGAGTFNVSWDNNGSLYTMVNGKVAREQIVSRDLMLGVFLGGSYSNSDIKGDFAGSSEGKEISGGAYFFSRLSDSLYADGFGSLGYSFNNIELADNVLSMSGDHNVLTWQVGGSLTGVYELDSIQLRPNVSLSYGNSNIGLLNFKASAYGISEDVSLDADNVAMGTLRVTSEVLFPVPFSNTDRDTDWISISPALICEHVVADSSSTDCGWGAGIGLTSEVGFGTVNTRVDWQNVGGIDSITGQLNYSHNF